MHTLVKCGIRQIGRFRTKNSIRRVRKSNFFLINLLDCFHEVRIRQIPHFRTRKRRVNLPITIFYYQTTLLKKSAFA